MGKTLKKIFMAVIAAAVLAGFSGCALNDAVNKARGEIFENINFEDDSNYTVVEPKTAVDCEYYVPLEEITYGYDSLTTDEQRNFYSDLSEAVYKISEESNENGLYAVGKVTVESEDFSEADMHFCIKAFSMDHPEVFWISNMFSYGSMGSQSIIQLYSYVSGTECKNKIEELNTAVENIITSIPDGLNQYHLEKYIHNTLLENCSYAEGVNSADDGWESFTSYGALTDGNVVCEGYSYAMCLLLSKVGIPAYCVNGYSNDELHMWNTVNIDGNWYHIDATWDDSENTYYNYFNLNDEQIGTDHSIAPLFGELEKSDVTGSDSAVFNVYVPECSSDSANYYVVESTYIYDYDEVTPIMVNDLVEAAYNKDTDFTIRFDSALDFDDALNVMFNDEPYYMFGYIEQANDQLDAEYEINSESVSILIVENFNSVVVKLEYK